MDIRSFTALFACLYLAAGNASASEPRLFLIQSYAPNFWTKGIREGLLSQPKIRALSLKEYYFDSDFWGKKGKIADAKDEALDKFVAEITSDDLLIIADDEASTVVLPKIKNPTRTLLVGINGSSQSQVWNGFCGSSGHGIVFEEYPYEKALAMARKRFPRLSAVNAIGGDTATSRMMIEDLKSFLVGKSTKLSETTTSGDWNAWRGKLQEWNSPTSVTWIFVPFGLRDSLNEEISPAMVSRWIASHTKNATIGALALGDGVDVGIGLSPNDLGREAGQLAEKILSTQRIGCRNSSRSYKISMTARSKR